MDFFKLMQSLDELLFEIVSWFLFYPLTLWRMIHSPLKTMASAKVELAEAAHRQFDDTIPPPLFLALTLVLVHVVELGVLGHSYLATVNPELSRTIGSHTNLTVLRIVIIALLPLTAAVRFLRAQGSHIDRPAIKAPFYSQCYAAALFGILMALAFFAQGREVSYTGPAFLSVMALAFAWMFLIEACWFAAQLKASFGRGALQAAILMAEWIVLVIVVIGFFATRR
jgi:hypothetical protein